ncbi:MAG: DUF523 and DUF1722 domain-containing protein [Actinobacteria bacterium]|nr:DUF523 and DUF1722 domain-containing protein [Actinomycetota bacterium]MDI6831329.1 DUF523 and DUF1722 domain-containing protein [Actinomycetota bacterium]
MAHEVRPVLVASRCLGFAACRWNGEIIRDEFVERLAKWADVVTVCPEVEIGLGVPRDPIHMELTGDGLRLVQPATGRDVSEEMLDFSRDFLSRLAAVDGFLLKARSPSCGITDVKIHAPGGRSGAVDKGPGFFGAAVLAAFPDLPTESEGRLKNWRIREHFLTRLFTLARFRVSVSGKKVRELVDFHASHKLLLMAYSQSALKRMGALVANREGLPSRELARVYRVELEKALARMPRFTSNINVLMHALGYFSKELRAREKAHFLDALERYRQGRIPLSAVNSIVSSWIARFDQPYLEQQYFFNPYPEELALISDSGKGRDL